MSTETWRVLQHETTNGSDLQNTMIGIMDAADATLGYRGLLWKDGAGTVQQALAKDELASTLDLTLSDTTGVAKIIHGGDTDTYLAMETNKITARAGSVDSIVANATSVSLAVLLKLTTCSNAATDTDKFLVLDATNNVDFRTGTEVLSDIGLGRIVQYYVSDYATVAAAITAIGATECVLWIDKDETLTGNAVFPATTRLAFTNGAILTPGAFTATINRLEPMGAVQIFSGAGVLFAVGAVPYVMPEWWGADATGAADSTNAIQYAIDSLIGNVIVGLNDVGIDGTPTNQAGGGGGRVVFAIGGTYKVSNTILYYPWIIVDGNGAELKAATGLEGKVMFNDAPIAGYGTNFNNHYIRDIVLNGNAIADSGVYARGTLNGIYEDIKVWGCVSHGFDFRAINHVRISRCISTLNGGAGCYLGAPADNPTVGCTVVHATSNHFCGNVAGGLWCASVTSSLIEQCKLMGNVGHDLRIEKENVGNLILTLRISKCSMERLHGATNACVLVKNGTNTILDALTFGRAGGTVFHRWIENWADQTIVDKMGSSTTAPVVNPVVAGDYAIIECNGGSLMLLNPQRYASNITTLAGYAADSAGTPVGPPLYTAMTRDDDRGFWITEGVFENKLGVGIAPDSISILRTGVSSANNETSLDAFTSGAEYSKVWLRKSESATLGTKTATVSGRTLGLVGFEGVSSNSQWAQGASIYAIQNGVASATLVPTRLFLTTNSDTAVNINQVVLHNNGSVGLLTSVPLSNVGTSAGDFTGTGLHVKGTAETYLIVEGNAAHLVLCDTDGATNDKDLELIVDGGVAAFRALNDATTVRTDNILVMDLGTGYTGFGIAAAASRIHAYVDSALDMTAADGVILNLEQDNASGDAAIGFEFTGGQRYSIGIDVNNSNHPLVVYDVTDSVWYMSFVTGSITIAPASDIDTTWGCTGPATLCRMDWGLGFTHYPDSRGVSFGTDLGTSPDGKIYSDGTNLKIDTTGYAQFSGVLNVEAGKRVACGGGSTGAATTAIGTVTLQIGNQLYTLPFTAVTSI